MKKTILRIFFSCIFLFGQTFVRAAPSSSRNQSDPVFREDGNNRSIFSLSVGSETPVSPYANISWINDSLTDGNEQLRQHRVTVVQNPNSTTDLLIGSSSTFNVASMWFFVPSSSGSWTTFNHATFYMMLGPGGSTTTVRGYIERE